MGGRAREGARVQEEPMEGTGAREGAKGAERGLYARRWYPIGCEYRPEGETIDIGAERRPGWGRGEVNQRENLRAWPESTGEGSSGW